MSGQNWQTRSVQTAQQGVRKKGDRQQAVFIKTRRKQIICIISDTASESSMLNGQVAWKTPDGVCCLGALQHNMNPQSSSILQIENLSVFPVLLRLCTSPWPSSAALLHTLSQVPLRSSSLRPFLSHTEMCACTWQHTHRFLFLEGWL